MFLHVFRTEDYTNHKALILFCINYIFSYTENKYTEKKLYWKKIYISYLWLNIKYQVSSQI